MPVQACQKNGKPGYKWGDTGTCYPFDPKSEASKAKAREKAQKQGRAVEARKSKQGGY